MSRDTYKSRSCNLCGSASHKMIKTFSDPPFGENTFGIEGYYRELWRCDVCGLFANRHNISLDKIYSGAYGDASYGGAKMLNRYKKIMALPPENSDNRQRVRRITKYMSKFFPTSPKKVLDIGSGMAVFPAVMAEEGWQVVAVDPDPKNVEHAENIARVQAILGEFPSVDIRDRFPLITFNKVLEHIEPVVHCLASARDHMLDGGVVYIELPDGEAAIEHGPERQEFFLEHYYAFSATSISMLASCAGFRVHFMERVVDPSGKYTLTAYLSK